VLRHPPWRRLRYWLNQKIGLYYGIASVDRSTITTSIQVKLHFKVFPLKLYLVTDLSYFNNLQIDTRHRKEILNFTLLRKVSNYHCYFFL
jgi:hypothetical protein